MKNIIAAGAIGIISIATIASAQTDVSVRLEGSVSASSSAGTSVQGRGEAEEKGNVEYGWKVEEGQKAAGEESGEKGGTEDINIGVGELQEGRVNKVDAITVKQSMRGGISVAAGDVDGLTEEEKKTFLASMRAHAQVRSEQDLENFARGVLLDNDDVEEVIVEGEKVVVKHRAMGKFLGFVPVTFTEEVEVRTSASTAIERVRVRFPWYAFLIVKDVVATDIEADINAEAAAGNEKWIKGSDWTYADVAATITLVSNVLKTKHDTVKNSINNVR